MSENRKLEHERIQDIELYLDEIKPLLTHIEGLRTAMVSRSVTGLPFLWPPIWMSPPPPPPPPEFTRTINKKNANRGDFELTGPHVSQTTDNGTVLIESKATKKNTTSITVKHPPPVGEKNQTHNLTRGSRVTVQPNGDLLIQIVS